MTVLHQPDTMGDVLKYEVNPNYTRDTVTLISGTAFPVGAVLGRVTASGSYTLSPDSGADGSETATAVLLFAVDATLADAVGVVITRGPAIVSRTALAFDASVDDPTKIATKHAQLAALGIIARIWSEATRIDLRVAEVAQPRPGERIEIDGEAFLIQGEPVRDRERLVWTINLRPAGLP